MKSCPITRMMTKDFLIASHIKTWIHSNNEERVNTKNGILLSPLFDKLFDKGIGLITFTTEKRILISNKISKENIARLNISNNQENRKFRYKWTRRVSRISSKIYISRVTTFETLWNISDKTDRRKSKGERKYTCEICGEKTKVFRMFDIDGTNLVEALVCLNCRDGELPTKSKLFTTT